MTDIHLHIRTSHSGCAECDAIEKRLGVRLTAGAPETALMKDAHAAWLEPAEDAKQRPARVLGGLQHRISGRVSITLTALEAEALYSAAQAIGSGDEQDLAAVLPDGKDRAAYERAMEKLQQARWAQQRP